MNYKALIASIIAIFAPIKAALITIIILVFVDLILGIMCAVKRGEKITSSGMRRTITKIFIFEMAILAGYLTEMYLMGGHMPLSKVVAAYIGLVEYKSILENLEIINGDSIFNSLLKKLNKRVENEEEPNA